MVKKIIAIACVAIILLTSIPLIAGCNDPTAQADVAGVVNVTTSASETLAPVQTPSSATTTISTPANTPDNNVPVFSALELLELAWSWREDDDIYLREKLIRVTKGVIVKTSIDEKIQGKYISLGTTEKEYPYHIWIATAFEEEIYNTTKDLEVGDEVIVEGIFKRRFFTSIPLGGTQREICGIEIVSIEKVS